MGRDKKVIGWKRGEEERETGMVNQGGGGGERKEEKVKKKKQPFLQCANELR